MQLDLTWCRNPNLKHGFRARRFAYWMATLMALLAIGAPAHAFGPAFLVKDIYPGPGESFPQYLSDVHGTLYFTAGDGISARQTWISDGTADGTRIAGFGPGGSPPA